MKRLFSIPLTLLFSGLWGAYALGQIPLDIQNTQWLIGDLATTHIAWVQYLSDPQATLLTSNRSSYPLPMDFSLFDPIPIALLISSNFRDFLPDGQYFGIYFLLCTILQGFFGYLVIGELLKHSKIDNSAGKAELIKIAGGLFFALAPYTINRFRFHTALASQWLLVCCLWISLKTRNFGTSKWLAANCGIVFLTTGFNPYLFFMTCISVLIFAIIDTPMRAIAVRAFRAVAVCATGLLGLKAFGFLSAASAESGGYGLYSMNIISPIDSNGLSGIWKHDFVQTSPHQSFEGYMYLGAGLLATLLFSAILMLRAKKYEIDFPLLPASFVVAVSFLLALSTTISFLTHSIHIIIPESLELMLSKFRASGRFFWIGAFWLIPIGFYFILSRFNLKISTNLILILTIVQLIDVAPIGYSSKEQIAGYKRIEMASNDANLLTKNIKSILVFPPWQCSVTETPGGNRNFEIFGAKAAELNISTNNFYAARTRDEQKLFHCNPYNSLANPSPDAAYFIKQNIYNEFSSSFEGKFQCQKSTDLLETYVCTPLHSQ